MNMFQRVVENKIYMISDSVESFLSRAADEKISGQFITFRL